MPKKDSFIYPVNHEQGTPKVKRPKILRKLSDNNSSELCQEIISYLVYFETHQYLRYSREDYLNVNDFVSAVFTLIVDPRFTMNNNDAQCMISYSHIFSNLVATSSYRNTDGPLGHVILQENNFAKILFLYSSRNNIKLDMKKFFDVQPKVASLWFNAFMTTTSCPNRTQMENLFQHLENMDDRWEPPNPYISSVFFTCTYLNPTTDLKVKGIMNRAMKKMNRIEVVNNPDPNKIAIVSAKWHRNHAIYKSAGKLIEQLKGHYDLTLIHLGDKKPPNLVTEGFSEVMNVSFGQGSSHIQFPKKLVNNKFQLIYYPDIGMNSESVWMGNTRLAPIQVMGYGHPSTSGEDSEIDYFIGGTIEKGKEDCYSEQMILLPGLAQHPAFPTYEKKGLWEPSDKVRISCAWGPDKYNSTLLSILKRASQLATEPHEFHFFPSPGINRYAGYVPFCFDIARWLPNAIVHADKEYYEYMEAMENMDFGINSFPFGGYNTVVESFYLGIPVVTLEGDRFYNRAASHLLRQVGLEELSSQDVAVFAETISKMINDKEYRDEKRKYLHDLDLREKLFSEEDDHFKQAIDYIIANHPITESVIIGESDETD